MSTEVRRQLAELAEQRQARRRMVGEIRQESVRALERAHWFYRVWHSDRSGGDQPESSVLIPLQEGVEQETVLVQVPTGPESDVLAQVQRLLGALDQRDREFWTEEDTIILFCLTQIRAAAARKGYTREELQDLLHFLDPPW